MPLLGTFGAASKGGYGRGGAAPVTLQYLVIAGGGGGGSRGGPGS